MSAAVYTCKHVRIIAVELDVAFNDHAYSTLDAQHKGLTVHLIKLIILKLQMNNTKGKLKRLLERTDRCIASLSSLLLLGSVTWR